MATSWPFYELVQDAQTAIPDCLVRLPMELYSAQLLPAGDARDTGKLAIPWITVTLADKLLVCRAVPSMYDEAGYVEARSTLWMTRDDAGGRVMQEEVPSGRCIVSATLLPRLKLAASIEVETVESPALGVDAGSEMRSFLADASRFTSLMRATLTHKPVTTRLLFRSSLFGEHVFRVVSITVSTEGVKDGDFVMVAPKTVFTLRQKTDIAPLGNRPVLTAPLGLEGPFRQIRDLIDPRTLGMMRAVGIPPPRGMLMSGPPGVGKTFLVRRLAEQTGIPLMVVNGPEIVSPVAGESEANLERAFSDANRAALSSPLNCAILFFDEIDAIARKREESAPESLTEVRLLTQLLTTMDGFGPVASDAHVIVMAATNRPDALDPAMRRPGRFDREVVFDPPDASIRAKILAGLTATMTLDGDVDLERVARNCVGYVAADLAALCREAVLQEGRASVGTSDFASARAPVRMSDFIAAMRRVGPSLHRQYQIQLDSRVTWNDIAGIDVIKTELRRFIEWPLLYPEAYARMGLSPPRGVLLHGPPGCSKTTIAKAIANDSGFTFYSLNGATLYSCYVGESEQQIRDVFQCARMTAPSIVFLDEVDTLVGKRSRDVGVGTGDPVQERVLSTLLNEMDGVASTAGKAVLVVGATNRLDLIDEALLRPGRFDRHIHIPRPDEAGRRDILQLFLRGRAVADTVDVDALARNTSNFTGADLRNLVQEAAILAMHDGTFTFQQAHFDETLANPGRRRNAE